VRNKIKAFAQKKVTLPPGRHKIVILDEADRYLPSYFLGKSVLTRWSYQYDARSSTSIAANNGDILQHHSLLPRLQHVEQNYRAYSESVCDTEIREASRYRNPEEAFRNLQDGEGRLQLSGL
jgi:DNA polymerase III delta prime subunit